MEKSGFWGPEEAPSASQSPAMPCHVPISRRETRTIQARWLAGVTEGIGGWGTTPGLWTSRPWALALGTNLESCKLDRGP